MIPRRIGFFSLAWMTVYTFACFFVMRFVPRHFFRKPGGERKDKT